MVVLLHGLLLSQRMHEPLARDARRARQPRHHARPARPRRLRPPADMWRYSMTVLRPRGDRAARPPRASTEAVVLGTSLGANITLEAADARAGAAARHGGRDAGARQRAARLRARVHAADGRADVRRAGDARRSAPRACAVPRAGCRGRPTSCSTGCARTRRRAPPCSRACSSAASRRTAGRAARDRDADAGDRPQARPGAPVLGRRQLAAELPERRACCRRTRSSSCAWRPSG